MVTRISDNVLYNHNPLLTKHQYQLLKVNAKQDKVLPEANDCLTSTQNLWQVWANYHAKLIPF